MPPTTNVLDHRVLFVLPFEPAPDMPWPPAGFVPCPRSRDERLRMYLTPEVHALLHADRVAWPGPLCFAAPGVVVDQLEIARVKPELGLVALVLRVLPEAGGEGQPALDRLMAFVDQGRLRGPLWPGQPRFVWTCPEAPGAPHEAALEDWLLALVPGSAPILADPRLFAFTYVAFDSAPPPGLVYAIAAADPPGMPWPSEDFVADFFAQNAYRRWESDGTFYAFLPVSGALVRAPDAPGWMGGVVADLYLDVAGFVAAVAAHRHWVLQRIVAEQEARLLRGEHQRRIEVEAHLRDFEWPRFSEQDQGRQLVRQWLGVIERDYGDLERLTEHGR